MARSVLFAIAHIQGGYTGTGNINADPRFENTSDPDGVDNVWGTPDDGLRQRGGSRVVNRGTNTGAPSTDIIGISRSKGSKADMGAYERGLIYVDKDATGSNNGSSWVNAYKSLATALGAATAADEIWVADGTYRPTTGADRTATFQLKSDVAVYGGFNATETARSQRSWTTKQAILSGDIGTGGDSSDNSYHVVTGGGTYAILDGFTITGGNANGASTQFQHVGGGMYNSGTSPTVANVVFTQNTATYGGGMFNYSSASPQVTNTVFSQNRAQSGAGMYNHTSCDSAIVNSVFTGNIARTSGGAIVNYKSSPTLMNCTLTGNVAYTGGR